MSDAARSKFVDDCNLRTFGTKITILSQGEMGSGLLFVADGSVEVSYVSEDGNKAVVYVSVTGDVLGVVEAIAERPYAASCKALPGTTLLFCSKAQLDQQLSCPAFVRNFAGHIHDLLERDNRNQAVHQFYTAEQRICTYLHELSARRSDLRLSQSYLATVAGCSRQTVNRELGVLRDAGFISLARGQINVLDRAALLVRISSFETG